MRISGRVVVRESGEGVENLIVAMFSAGGSAPSDVRDPSLILRQVGRRLGSGATDYEGRFGLEIGPDRESAALELLLVVFPPDESESIEQPFATSPAEKRPLFFTRLPRVTNGAEEAYVIRIPARELESVGLLSGSSVEQEVERRVSVEEGNRRVEAGVRERLGPERRERLRRSLARGKSTRRRFDQLSALTTEQRSDEYRVERIEDAPRSQLRAIDVRMQSFRERAIGLPLPADADALARLGLSPVDGVVAGTITADAWMREMFRGTGGDLVRTRTPLELIPKPEQHRVSLMTDGRDHAAEDGAFSIDAAVRAVIDPDPGYVAPLRPDASVIEQELAQLQIPGPSEVAATHDFHVLQVAWKNTWIQLFSDHLRDLAAELYDGTIGVLEDMGVEDGEQLVGADAVADVSALRDLQATISKVVGAGAQATPAAMNAHLAAVIAGLPIPPAVKNQLLALVGAAAGKQIESSDDARTRLERLLLRLSEMLREPYAFDVFAEGTCNFGIMLTYRQTWTPRAYQTGDLVATIPLAPGETRKYSKKSTVRVSHAEKVARHDTNSGSESSSATTRLESEVIRKVSTSTNFKLSAEGKFNIGIGSVSASSEFDFRQSQDSAMSKKALHEATMKAALEYRHERSVEVEARTGTDLETVTEGQIANPNNEISVTYLFYELERVYHVLTQLYRARGVVMVAQRVPSPDEIDEAWLLSNAWILGRVLLDDSLRPGLEYLTSGFAGDETSSALLLATWEGQRDAVALYEGQVTSNRSARDALRTTLIGISEELATSDKAKTSGILFALGPLAALASGTMSADATAEAKARQEAAEARLKYVDEALALATSNYDKAFAAFADATKALADARQRELSRHVAIDQLRAHVKANILYYMQALWAHEPADQRFLRLYRKKAVVPIPKAEPVTVTSTPFWGINVHWSDVANSAIVGDGLKIWAKDLVEPTLHTKEIDLSELADLDNPLGFKGNYMIFPLRQPTWLTSVMLAEFVDEYFGLRDPDVDGNVGRDELLAAVEAASGLANISDEERAALADMRSRLMDLAGKTEEDVVLPTGQLFIEALPGAHPLLEDFKLRHRYEDLRRVHGEVARAELENLRLAARIMKGELENPVVERRILVEGKPVVTSDV